MGHEVAGSMTPQAQEPGESHGAWGHLGNHISASLRAGKALRKPNKSVSIGWQIYSLPLICFLLAW